MRRVVPLLLLLRDQHRRSRETREGAESVTRLGFVPTASFRWRGRRCCSWVLVPAGQRGALSAVQLQRATQSGAGCQ